MQNVPTIVRAIVSSNQQFKFAGIGPISKTSMGLYTGRYYNPVSGRTATIAKPKVKYMNPYNYHSTISYLQANILYKWNNFVRAVQTYQGVAIQDP